MANRAFRGIWIPSEIWLCKDLTMQEKLFLVEIDSLDNEDGCYASNNYFSDFFNITRGRVSQVIKKLESNGWLTVDYKYNEKEITSRVIKINRPPFPCVDNKLNTYLENADGVVNKLKGGYLENADGVVNKLKDNNTSNNTSINNTDNNTNGKKPKRHKYGEYSHVLLSDDEYEKLKAEYSNADELIKHLDEYCEMTGKTYKNYALTIRKWVVDAVSKKPKEDQPKETEIDDLPEHLKNRGK